MSDDGHPTSAHAAVALVQRLEDVVTLMERLDELAPSWDDEPEWQELRERVVRDTRTTAKVAAVLADVSADRDMYRELSDDQRELERAGHHSRAAKAAEHADELANDIVDRLFHAIEGRPETLTTTPTPGGPDTHQLTDALRAMLAATDSTVNSEGADVDLDALYEARADARAALDL